MPYLVIDFDSTFVKLESLDELAEIALRKNPKRNDILRDLRSITMQGMEGKIGFEQSLALRVRMFRANKQQINELIDLLKINVSTSIKRNSNFFMKHADKIYIISGGFSDYIVPVVADYGIKASHVLANHFIFLENGSVDGYDKSYPLASDNGKVKQLIELKLRPPVYVIGDGYTDYMVRHNRQAEKFCAYVENISREAVVSKADIVLDNFDQLVEHLDV